MAAFKGVNNITFPSVRKKESGFCGDNTSVFFAGPADVKLLNALGQRWSYIASDWSNYEEAWGT